MINVNHINNKKFHCIMSHVTWNAYFKSDNLDEGKWYSDGEKGAWVKKDWELLNYSTRLFSKWRPWKVTVEVRRRSQQPSVVDCLRRTVVEHRVAGRSLLWCIHRDISQHRRSLRVDHIATWTQIDWVKVLRPTPHKRGLFGNVLPSQSLCILLLLLLQPF